MGDKERELVDGKEQVPVGDIHLLLLRGVRLHPSSVFYSSELLCYEIC